MEECRFPKAVLITAQEEEKKEDDPGDTGEIYEAENGNNIQTIE